MRATHDHPRLVAVRAGIPDDKGRREFCSGTLISSRLVLTCRHGVVRAGEPQPPGVEVQLVTGRRGGIRLGEPIPGRVVWQGSSNLDAILVELDGRAEVPEGFLAGGLAWGEPIGTLALPVTVTGMPKSAMISTENPAEIESSPGRLIPMTYTVSDRYAIDLNAWPHAWHDWAGMSGAAVTTGNGSHLLAVVAWSDKPYEGRRLSAVPVRALLSDSGFCQVLGRYLEAIPEVEPVELAPYLSRPRPSGSLGGLLRADAAVVTFRGRDE